MYLFEYKKRIYEKKSIRVTVQNVYWMKRANTDDPFVLSTVNFSQNEQ